MNVGIQERDTICALATAQGGAIAVVRVSGQRAVEIVGTLCAKDAATFPSHRAVHTNLLDNGALLDDAIVTVFRAPHSYTGEDGVEISCHGSRYITQRILDLLVASGCRMAAPGEYTMRAYLNGKLDLSQAEAVADLISSANKATHQIAMSQLKGHFSTELSQLREKLLKLTSLLELELDFSDHEDLEFADRSELKGIAMEISSHISKLAKSFETGQAFKQGIPVAIIGKTNVGKSTLLNQLVKDDRAIVSDVHGTTRDTVEDVIDINGVSFRFIDTAGIRQTTDAVELIGIERTYKAVEKAQIIIWVVDEKPTPEELQDIFSRLQGKQLILAYNKIDLPSVREHMELDQQWDNAYSSVDKFVEFVGIGISAKEGKNMDALEKMIYQCAKIPELKDTDIIVTSARHYEALVRAQESIQQVIMGMRQNLSSDLLAEELRQVLSYLAEITGGAITTSETLENIFRNFCVGK